MSQKPQQNLGEDLTRLLESLSAALRGERPELNEKIAVAASAVADVFRALVEPVAKPDGASEQPAAAPEATTPAPTQVQRISLDE